MPTTGSRSFTPTELLALALCVISGVGLVCWIVWRCRSGIDFTDEGFYLNWISQPSLYKASHTQFGFIYHPLYQMLGGDIVALRQANILITFTLAAGLFFAFFRWRYAADGSAETSGTTRPVAAALGIAFAPAALVYLHQWILTPSYNSLALQALLLTGIGLILAMRSTSKCSWIGWALLGIGGYLAFMAKPTTAALLGIVVGVVLFFSRRLRSGPLTVSVSMAGILLLASSWIIDGSPRAFLKRLTDGVGDIGKLQGNYEFPVLFRLDRFALTGGELALLAGAILGLFVSWLLAHSGRGAARITASLISAGLSLGTLSLAWEAVHLTQPLSRFAGLQFFSMPLASLLVVLASLRQSTGTRLRCILAFCFGAFTYAYAFGTNGNYWINGSWAGAFWVLAGIAFLPTDGRANRWPAFVPFAAVAQLITAVILALAMEQPYRQTQPLRLNTTAIDLGAHTRLLVSADFAQYLGTLGRMAKSAGFQKGDPIIDLTGHYPTALYALEAKPLGLPWLCGGYRGSNDMVMSALDRIERRDLQRAWLITEPAGPRALSPGILKRYGLDLDRDYVEVGTLDSPTGTYPDSFKQHLLKPRR